MKKAVRIVAALALFFAVASCSSNVTDIKSPCVAKDGGPCGPKRPINDWWLKNTQQYKTNS